MLRICGLAGAVALDWRTVGPTDRRGSEDAQRCRAMFIRRSPPSRRNGKCGSLPRHIPLPQGVRQGAISNQTGRRVSADSGGAAHLPMTGAGRAA
jgi:hypothetical protein